MLVDNRVAHQMQTNAAVQIVNLPRGINTNTYVVHEVYGKTIQNVHAATVEGIPVALRNHLYTVHNFYTLVRKAVATEHLS